VLDPTSPDRQRIPLWLQLPIFAVVGCCLVVLAVVALIHFQQHSLIYHPRPYGPIYAHVLPSNGVEIEYTLPFGKQVAFYISQPNEPPKRVWVAFCGNGSLALDWTGLLPGYPPNGDAFLLVDYPGYGKNSGYATIDSTRATAEGAVQALAERLHVDQEQLTLCAIGHSLGAAAALDFATRHRVQHIVIVAPFTSLRDEAATVVGQHLAHLLIENYDNRENIRAIFKRNPQVRVDIFHGTDDAVIPVRMGRALAKEFPALGYHEIRGADHVAVMDDARDQIIAAMAEQ
jgi:pimeloyl-ACP methyl ester carboxylesterase